MALFYGDKMELNSEYNQKIKEFYEKRHGQGISPFLRENPNIDDYLKNIVLEEPWFQTKIIAFCLFAKGIYAPMKCNRCHCNNRIDAKKANKGRTYCSTKCGRDNEESKEKTRNTMFERYGGATALESPVIREKIKKTMFEKYGVEHPSESRELKEKKEQNNLKKYGVRHTLQLESTKEKSKQTWKKKYGAEHPMLNREMVEKTIARNIEKYGARSTAQLEGAKQKQEKTNIERYGCKCALCNEEIKSKSVKTCQEKYGTDNAMQDMRTREMTSFSRLMKSFDNVMERWKPHVIPLFVKEDYKGFDKPFEYKWKCSICGTEFEQRIYVTGLGEDRYIPRCPSCYPLKESMGEQEVRHFIESVYDKRIETHDRNMIRPLELDIYLPDKNVAIEFDGLYWHSEEKGKDEGYHLNKTEECERKGVHLIHIFEDEWNHRQEIVKDRIRSIFGLNKKIFARKCVVKELNSKDCNEFLDINHLQGRDNSKYRYGLYFEEKLVALMTFSKPRFNKNYNYELIRYCSKIGYNVVGGASKLLAYFRKLHNGSMVSYADRRYSDGNLYNKLGFAKIGVSKPNYWYVKNNEKLNRYRCQKHKLAKLLGNGYDENLSEYENMVLNGYNKIYDCGNLVYALKK